MKMKMAINVSSATRSHGKYDPPHPEAKEPGDGVRVTRILALWE